MNTILQLYKLGAAHKLRKIFVYVKWYIFCTQIILHVRPLIRTNSYFKNLISALWAREKTDFRL